MNSPNSSNEPNTPNEPNDPKSPNTPNSPNGSNSPESSTPGAGEPHTPGASAPGVTTPGVNGPGPYAGTQQGLIPGQSPYPGPQQNPHPGTYSGPHAGGAPGAPMGSHPGTPGYAGGGFQQAPKAPRSEPAGPARTLEVGSTSRTFMRTVVAIIGALALLIPASALAYGGVGLARLVHEETSYDLPIDADALAVSVDTATVRVSVSDEFDTPRVRHVYQGRDVDVQGPQVDDSAGTTTIDMERSTDSHRWWGPNAGMENTLHLELPTDYAEELDLDVTSRWGFTDVEGDFANVSTESEAGAIVLDVAAADVSVKTRAGFIDVSGAMDTLTLATSTGYIETSTVDVSESLSAKTNAGGVNLGLGENAVPTEGIEAHARTGSVDIGLPREDRVRGMNLAGYSVNASARSGMVDVEVQQSNPGEGVIPVTVSAASGNVNVFYQDDIWGSEDTDTDDSDDFWGDDWNDDGDSGSEGTDGNSGDGSSGDGGAADSDDSDSASDDGSAADADASGSDG